MLGLFIGMGPRWSALYRLRRAITLAQARDWLTLLAFNGCLSMASAMLTIGAGLYLVLTAWSWRVPWILMSLGAMALMMALMMALNLGVAGRRLPAAGLSAASADDLTPELRRKLHDPLPWVATQMGGATALGIVFLMTVKPGLGVSLAALALALLLGVVAGYLTARGEGWAELSTVRGDVIENVHAY